MSNIPSEIIAEVLSRVPALSLLRFKCVSKSWRALIDSPEFIKSHLNRTIETNSDLRLILYDYSYFSAELDVVDRNHDAEFSISEELEDYSDHQIVGSCHGLLCLQHVGHDGIEIMNPTTRKVLTLPSYVLEEEFADEERKLESLCCGFGYDRLSDDYKVLGIILPDDSDDCEARVFSVKSNSWRKVGSFPFPHNGHPGILVTGALHWIVKKPGSEREFVVVVFDLETEEYRLVELPPYLVNDDFQPDLYLLGESLCFCNDVKVNPVEFWVMKTCGDKDSWTKLCRVSYWISSRCYQVIPIAYSSGGKQIVFTACDYLFLYDLSTKKIRYLSTLSVDDPGGASLNGNLQFQICFGSLVQLGRAKSIPARPTEAVLGDER